MLDTQRQDINRGEEVSDLKMSLYVDKGEDRRGTSALGPHGLVCRCEMKGKVY